MAQKEVFDVSKEPASDHERYGKYDLGRHCLLARRLLERGATFVQVSAFELRHPQRELQLPHRATWRIRPIFAALVADLADRGMLDSTLMWCSTSAARRTSTFTTAAITGRTPGRLWSPAARFTAGWRMAKTNAKGTEVVDGQVDHANLFHTYLQAMGVDSTDTPRSRDAKFPWPTRHQS